MADQLQKGDEVSLVLLLCFLTLRRKPCIANQCPYIYIYIWAYVCCVGGCSWKWGTSTVTGTIAEIVKDGSAKVTSNKVTFFCFCFFLVV